MNKQTTLRLNTKTKKELRSFQVHPRETDEDIISRLIKNQKLLKTEKTKNELKKII